MNRAAFDRQLVAALPYVRRVVGRWLLNTDRANDLVQEAVLHALEAAPSYREDGNMPAWLLRIARNRMVSGYRRAWRTVELDEGVAERQPALETPADGLELRDVARVIGTLPGPMREALTLVTIDGLPHEAVAARLGVAVGTIKSRVSRARILLGERAA